METLGIDLFYLEGMTYFCMVDKFSGYPFVHKLKTLNTRAIIKQLNLWFWEFGFPKNIRSDGGPQFRNEFEEFCRANGINKQLSSPYNPQSNGLAEAAVKQMKFLLKKTGSSEDKFRPALLAWRNMPRADGYSPTQMFFGYRQLFGQMTLDTHSFTDRQTALESRDKTTRNAQTSFDKRSKDLKPLNIGQRVYI